MTSQKFAKYFGHVNEKAICDALILQFKLENLMTLGKNVQIKGVLAENYL